MIEIYESLHVGFHKGFYSVIYNMRGAFS